MPTRTDIVKCKKCGVEVLWADLRQHHITQHGLKCNRKPTPIIALGPNETYQQIRTLAKEMIIQIDDERNTITKRLKELDTMATKYKDLV